MRNTSKIAITRVIKIQLHDIKRQYVIEIYIYIYEANNGGHELAIKKKKKTSMEALSVL